MSSCARHPHERGVSPCRRCGAAWCGDCLVYAFGGRKLPYCMSCAMFAGGIRTEPGRPALSKRQVKQLVKAHKARPADAPAVPVGDVRTAGLAEGHAEPREHTPTATDWEKPWWEDRQPTLAHSPTNNG